MNARRLSISLAIVLTPLLAALTFAFPKFLDGPLALAAAAHQIAIGRADLPDAPAPYTDDLVLAPLADQT